MSALSELLTRANKNALSYEAIAQRATVLGHQLSTDTAWRYMTGRQAKVQESKLRALAEVLGLKYEQVRLAAGVPADLGEYQPPVEAHALTKAERDALDVIIRAMWRGKQQEQTGLRSAAYEGDHDDESRT